MVSYLCAWKPNIALKYFEDLEIHIQVSKLTEYLLLKITTFKSLQILKLDIHGEHMNIGTALLDHPRMEIPIKYHKSQYKHQFGIRFGT